MFSPRGHAILVFSVVCFPCEVIINSRANSDLMLRDV